MFLVIVFGLAYYRWWWEFDVDIGVGIEMRVAFLQTIVGSGSLLRLVARVLL